MRVARLILMMPLIILTILANSLGAYGLQSQDEGNKVVMIIVNRADLEDLHKMDEVQRIMKEGSLGLMNIRASGRYNEYKSYATIGWGTRAEASQETQIFLNIDEEIHQVYQRRIGEAPPLEGVVNLNINMLIQQNIRGEFGAVPGKLGEILRQNELKTVVLGSSHTDDSKISSAGLVAMDQKGYIDYGDVSKRLLVENWQKPFGVQTNYDLLFEEFVNLYPQGDFLVLETGDLTRLEHYKGNLTSKTYQSHKEEILEEIDGFIKRVVEEINLHHTLLMLVVPYPSEATFEAGNRLTPVVFYGGNVVGGVLKSDTTRRAGIIGNIDIAPTILAHYGINPEEMTGRSITEVAVDNNYDYIKTLNNRVLNTSQQRYRVLYTFAVFVMLASVLALLAIFFRKKINYRLRNCISSILLATIVAPFSFLILPIFGNIALTNTYIVLISINGLIVILLKGMIGKESVKLLLVSTGLIVLGIAIDVILGQNLIKNSILGYDPIIGARYYGIGNEFTGVLLGSTLIFSSALMERSKRVKWAIPVFYLFMIIVIGFPKWGANVGGTITAMFAFLFTAFRLLGNRMNIKKLLLIGCAVILGVGTFAVLDLYVLESKSHLAGAIDQIIGGGPFVIIQIITRKIAMNIRVMGVTIWSRVLLMAVAVLSILFYKPIGVLKKIANEYPSLAVGWTGILVAAAIGFAVNDSGVVMAAMATIFLSTSILYLVLNEMK